MIEMPMLKAHPFRNFVFFLLLAVVSFFVSTGHCGEKTRETPVVKAVNKVGPAVVNISSHMETTVQGQPFSGFGMDPFFDSFFRDFFDPIPRQAIPRSNLGSGVIIDGVRGFILTNAHVIEKSGVIKVMLQDAREFDAGIVGADPDSDLAVLRINTEKPLPAIEMGDSDDLMIGETVIAIGNPFGFSNTVTTGVLSALNRSVRTDDRIYHEFIQTDASINPGNSGGPLLNINGELIGINTAIYAKAQGIGFAIPINRARRIVSDLIQYGEVIPAWIGVTVQNPDAQLTGYLRIPGRGGVLIRYVEPESPAEKAGIREGDILLRVKNRDALSKDDYEGLIRGIAPGETIDIDLWRGGREYTVRMKTGHFPPELAAGLAERLLGIRVKGISKSTTGGHGFDGGVMITAVSRHSYLARIGAKPGDVIHRMDEMEIKDIRDFEKTVIKYRKKSSVVILLRRGDRAYYLTVPLIGK